MSIKNNNNNKVLVQHRQLLLVQMISVIFYLKTNPYSQCQMFMIVYGLERLSFSRSNIMSTFSSLNHHSQHNNKYIHHDTNILKYVINYRYSMTCRRYFVYIYIFIYFYEHIECKYVINTVYKDVCFLSSIVYIKIQYKSSKHQYR